MTTPRKEIKTPIKARRLTSTPSPQTPQTPTVDSTIRRRVSDILVNLHKCVQIWARNNQDSFNTANTLTNLYGQWNTIQDSKNMEKIMSDECKRRFHTKLLKMREDLLEQLKQHQQNLEQLLCKMNNLLENVKAIYYLGLVSNKEINSSMNADEMDEFLQDVDPVIFSTWPAEKFHRTIQIMLSQYTKEYLLKMRFYDSFFKFRINESEDTTMLTQCVSVWLHQPYIDSSCKQNLDAMLLEAELK